MATGFVPFPSLPTEQRLLAWSAVCAIVAFLAAMGMLQLFLFATPGTWALAVGNAWVGVLLDAPLAYHAGMLALVGLCLARTRRPNAVVWALPLAVVALLEVFSIAVSLDHVDDRRHPYTPNATKAAAALTAFAQAASQPARRPHQTRLDAARDAVDTRRGPLGRADTLGTGTSGDTLTLHSVQDECRARVAEALAAPSPGYRLVSVNAHPLPLAATACARRVDNVLVLALGAAP